MIGPSGPMQSPDGIDAIIPINLAAIVFNDVNDVSFCVTGDLPPLGSTPFKYAINPGIPLDAAAGSSTTNEAANTAIPKLEPTHIRYACAISPSFNAYPVAFTRAFSIIPHK